MILGRKDLGIETSYVRSPWLDNMKFTFTEYHQWFERKVSYILNKIKKESYLALFGGGFTV